MEEWFGRLQAAGVVPNEVTYTTLLKGHARKGNTAQCHHWYDQMVSAGVQPNAQAFNTLMDGCAAAGDTALMEEWFGRMQAAGVAPDKVAHYGTLLKRLIEQGKRTSEAD
mmetsp:Transcript_3996/g.6783  ORF Transcript_3996/g.6783 Transcript_3996/m.6783 type:complete len:110 (-) Transcript_3996:239-568(-)